MEFDNIFPIKRELIEERVPHGRRFLFLDEVLELDVGKKAVAKLSDFTRAEYDWMEDHFPSFRVDPASILVEALAEVSGIAMLGLSQNRDKIAVLTGLDKWRFRKFALPTNHITLEANMLRIRSKFGRFQTKALSENVAVVAEGVIDLTIIERSQFPSK
ncbi:MAG: hypothetical protein AAB414_05455 [Patescibacteria group bacterium]